MKVAVLGAGALGAVYGVRLAARGGVDVAFVVRSSRVGSPEPLIIERVRGDVRERLASPERLSSVPADADVVLLAVGTEDIPALERTLGPSTVPIVALTPMLPKGWERFRDTFGDRAYAALPSVVAYTRSDGIVRYWTPPAPTRIDEPRARTDRGRSDADVVRELAAALSRAGLRARLELGVHEKNPATTVCFIGLAMALSLAGNVEALLQDDALLELGAQACRDGVRLAHRIGVPEPWAVLAPVVGAPWAVRTWLRLLGRLSPEAQHYAEEHFGRKLRAQHELMIQEMVELARERGLPHASFVEISARLARSPSPV